MYCRRCWFVRFLPSLSKFPFQTIKVRLDNLYCLFCKPLHCILSIVLILTCRLIHFSTFAYVIYMNSIHVSRLCINNSLHLVQKYSCGKWAFASRHICSKVVESAVLKWLLYWKKKQVCYSSCHQWIKIVNKLETKLQVTIGGLVATCWTPGLGCSRPD